VPFLNVFSSDAALLETIDNLVDIESADLAIVKSLNNVPLLIQSNLYHLGANFQYSVLSQH
jgi:hypothetical protein